MQRDLQSRDITTRSYSLKADSLNIKERSVEAVIATEDPVLVLDWNRFDVIEEILLMSGARLPTNGQVPMLDSHDRSSVQKQVGSTRNLRVEGDKLIGKNIFSQVAEHAWHLVREGHLKDNSIGYQVVNSVIIEAGKEAKVEGRIFRASPTRDLRVSTEWIVKENSVVSIGADANAKNRQYNLGEIKMTFEQFLEKRGFKLEDLSEAQRKALEADFEAEKTKQNPEDILTAERKRVADIRALGGDDVPAETIERCITEGKTVDETKAILLNVIRAGRASVSPNINTQITIGSDRNRDSLPRAISDAILCRAGINLYKRDGDDKFEKDKPCERSRQFMNVRICDMARQVLIAAGESDAATLSDREVIRRSISLSEIQQERRGGFSTLNLPVILGDTMHRSLLASYTEYPTQWPKFAKRTTHRDFREITRAQLGEVDNVEEIGEGGEYKYANVGERAEKYRLAKYGRIFGLTLEQMINDDLHAFSEIPVKLGQTARRLEDVLVFLVLTENAAMADGVVIFHANHGNFGSAAAISVESLNTAKIAFRKQTGVDGKTFINIIPKVLIIPVELEGIAQTLLSSEFDPADTNAKKANIWKGKLELCTHPLLSASSTAAWYLSAAPSQGGIEMCFLTSETVPYLEREMGFENDTLRFKIRHVCASKAIDHRALYKNPGA